MAATASESTFVQQKNKMNKEQLFQPKSAKKYKQVKLNFQRKSLQTLQPSASENELVSSTGVIKSLKETNKNGKRKREEKSGLSYKMAKKEMKVISQSKKPVTVYQDPEEPAPKESIAKPQADEKDKNEASERIEIKNEDKNKGEVDQEALDMMSSEEAPESYWKVIAERRREALAEALQENEQLHKKVETLQEENHKLSELASEAEYLAGVLKELTEDTPDTENTDDSSPPSDDAESS